MSMAASEAWLDRRFAPLQQSIDAIFRLVSEHATSEQWTEWLKVPLAHAAVAGNPNVVKDLLAAGGDATGSHKACHRRFPLRAAVQRGRSRAVSALVSASAKPDVMSPSDKEGWSPLHMAASCGHKAVAELLLGAGADVESQDHLGRTPLHLAVQGGHKKVVSVLLESGATPDTVDADGENPLHVAAFLGCEEMVSELVRAGAEVNYCDSDRCSPLQRAAHGGYLSAAKALVAAGADVEDRCGYYDGSALCIACSKGHMKMIRFLLNSGAEIFCDEMTRAPLHHAAQHDQARVVDVLIKAGAVTDAQDRFTFTPLHCAAHADSCNSMLALLRHGARVDAVTNDGSSPLHLACSSARARAVEVLLRWGANEMRVDNEGRAAYQRVGKHLDLNMPVLEITRNIKMVLGLLSRAPADRAWRRRGLLVLLRAFRHKVRLPTRPADKAFARDVPHEDFEGCRTKAKLGQARETAEVGPGYRSGMTLEVRVKADVGEVERCVGSPCVEARVVGLEQDVVFRQIVRFL